MQPIFDDLIRKTLMSAIIFVYILKAHMVVYIAAKFHDSSFSQTHVNVKMGKGRQDQFYPTHTYKGSKSTAVIGLMLSLLRGMQNIY